MSHGINQIIGRTIVNVEIREGESPNSRVFLYFSDGTFYELYSHAGRIEGLSGVHRTEKAPAACGRARKTKETCTNGI